MQPAITQISVNTLGAQGLNTLVTLTLPLPLVTFSL